VTPPPGPDAEPTVADLVDVLSLRIDVLGELQAADGPLGKRVLVERLDVSRSTVNRGIRRLRDLGLVHETPAGFATTRSGALACTEYLSFTEGLEAVLTAQDLVDHLPKGAPLSVEFLVDAEAVRPTLAASVRPAERISDLVRGADRIRGLVRTIARERSNEVLGEAVERGLEMEVVYPAEVFEYVYGNLAWVREHLGGRYTAYVNEVPYGLFLVDRPDEGRVASLHVFDDEGQLRGVFVADSDRAVAWAEGVYEQYRRDATPAPTG